MYVHMWGSSPVPSLSIHPDHIVRAPNHSLWVLIETWIFQGDVYFTMTKVETSLSHCFLGLFKE